MKKTISLLLSLILAASSASMLSGCEEDKAYTSDPDSFIESVSETETTAPPETEFYAEPNPAVAAYLEANKEAVISTLGANVASSSGLTYQAEAEVIGSGFVVTFRINELSYIGLDAKNQLQTSYNGLGSVFEASLKTMQSEIPELAYFKLIVCDKNGDLIATILAGEEK